MTTFEKAYKLVLVLVFMEYGSLLKKSWNDLKNNLVIFLPLLLSLGFIISFGILVLAEVMLFFGLGLTFESNLFVFLLLGLLFGFIDLFLLIFIGAAVRASYTGLLNPISMKKKASVKDLSFGLKNYTSIYFKIYMIIISIFILPLFLIGILAPLSLLVSKGFGIGVLIILGSLYLLYFIAAAIFIVFGFFFLDPIVSLNK